MPGWLRLPNESHETPCSRGITGAHDSSDYTCKPLRTRFTCVSRVLPQSTQCPRIHLSERQRISLPINLIHYLTSVLHNADVLTSERTFNTAQCRCTYHGMHVPPYARSPIDFVHFPRTHVRTCAPRRTPHTPGPALVVMRGSATCVRTRCRWKPAICRRFPMCAGKYGYGSVLSTVGGFGDGVDIRREAHISASHDSPRRAARTSTREVPMTRLATRPAHDLMCVSGHPRSTPR